MKRFVLSFALVALAMPVAGAQTLFRATLDGSQETPPLATTASGWATFVLNPDNTLTYFVNTQGLTGTAAHIHEGDAGVSGPIIIVLSGGPDIYSGTSSALDATMRGKLKGRHYYVNVHTAANPAGEIRGQIIASPLSYGAHAIGGEETPPVSTGALGDATFAVNPDNTITYSLTTTGLTGTAAHIHTGGVGIAGPITFALSGGPTTWSGTTSAMLDVDFNNLQSLGLYVNVHTGANPGGEIRGQIVKSFEPYGTACPGSAGTPSLTGSGAPTPAGTITLNIAGGKPTSAGLLLGSFTADCSRATGCAYNIGIPTLLIGLPLNGVGSITLSTPMPEIPSFDFYLQYFNFDSGAPNGQFSTTNGLKMPFTNY